MDNTEMKDSPLDNSSDASSDSNDDDSDAAPVETLVAGRQKRATAANRYDRQRILEEAEEEAGNDQDEVTLLFADDENEEDEEFEGSDEDDGDAELDSSSDDEDQGPNAQTEDLEGEKQLQREAKAERTRKRKARLELTSAAGMRKKVRIDPTLPKQDSAATRPTKRKERAFVLLDAEGRSRASLRTSTVANKEETEARLIEDEKQRAKLRAKKEKRERERARDEPPEMTQADRLAEAERMERKNAKSLNRWETMEKKRTEEQAAKLAALKNRKLEGPVVTYWSGVAKWAGPKLNQVGVRDAVPDGVEAKKRGRKPKAYHEQLAAENQKQADSGTNIGVEQSMTSTREQTSTPAPSDTHNNPADHVSRPATPMDTAAPQITFATPQGPDSFLNGTDESASLPSEAGPGSSINPQEVPLLQDPPTSENPAQPRPEDDSSQLPEPPVVPQISVQKEAPPSILPPEPPQIEVATRNLVILESFDDLAAKDRGEFKMFYNTRKATKLVKHLSEICPITGLPARYRDPSTGVAYANSYAYRKLQELRNHEHTWSSMLGCYVGRAGVVARGVPDGFLAMP